MGWTNADNKFGLSPFIVGTTLGDGCNYTVIQTAINDIAAGPLIATIYVRAGTYSEALTIPAGVGIKIIGAQSSPENSLVTIVGSVTHSGAGSSLGLENLAIGFTAAVSYTQTTSVTVVKNCVFFSTGNSAVQITTAGATFSAIDCQFITASISDLVQVTDSITTQFDQCFFSSATANIATYGSARIFVNYCKLTHLCVAADTSTITVQYSRTDNPVNPAYNATATATINAYHNIVNTTDASTFFAAGVGTFNWGDIVLLADQGVDPALTSNPQNWQPYAQTAVAAAGSVRGTASFDSATFSTTDGWVQLAGTAAANSFPTDAGTATPVAGVINILGGPGVTTTAAGNTISINSVIWSNAAAPVTVAADSGTFDVVGGIAITLPAAPAQGEECRIFSGFAGTIVTANAGQQIQIGNTLSSVGGTATGTDSGDSVVLVFFAALSRWCSIATNGNWTLA